MDWIRPSWRESSRRVWGSSALSRSLSDALVDLSARRTRVSSESGGIILVSGGVDGDRSGFGVGSGTDILTFEDAGEAVMKMAMLTSVQEP